VGQPLDFAASTDAALAVKTERLPPYGLPHYGMALKRF
jgi:hypothetical protein